MKTHGSHMNKTYINILCILIFGLLTYKVIMPALELKNVSGGSNQHQLTQTHTPFETRLSANKSVPFTPTDTLKSENGEDVPVIENRMILFIPDEKVPDSVRLISGICYLLTYIPLIGALYELIRYLLNVNRGLIFVKVNVKRMSRFGYWMLFLSALNIAEGLAASEMISRMEMCYMGRTFYADWELPWTTLTVGLMALLFSQVNARGLQLREEAELTI